MQNNIANQSTFRNSIDILERDHRGLERLEGAQRHHRVEPLQVRHRLLHLREERRQLLELRHAEQREARAVLE